MPTYRERYARFKDEVDSAMGRTRGRWARFKTYFLPNSFSEARKRAIEEAEEAWEWELLMGRMERNAKQLYQAHNIIGKTQVGGLRPTVYYRSGSGTFGHITQDHDTSENLGRAPPRKHPLYNLGNTGPDGVLEERYGEVVKHTSRAPIVLATTEDEREALSEAHRTFVRIKKRSLRRIRTNKAEHAELKL